MLSSPFLTPVNILLKGKRDFADIIRDLHTGEDSPGESRAILGSLQDESMRTSPGEVGRCYHESQKEVASGSYG